jgi:hypothetical protein
MKHKNLVVILAIFLLSTPLAVHKGIAQPTLILEAEQHWPTYQEGGTCCFGSNNLFAADVDGDDTVEIMTGGYMYEEANTSVRSEAPFKIWSWDGKNITLEKSNQWAGSIGAIHAADADNDGAVEILTAGSIINGSGYYGVLRVWNCNGDALILRASCEDVAIGSISISDLDVDGTPEIVTVGRYYDGMQNSVELCVWHLKGNSLTLQNSGTWGVNHTGSASSVCVYDLDGYDQVEIITGGYANELKNSSGQLRIWRWNREGFSLEANKEWQLVEGVYGLTSAGSVQGNTVINNVKVGDVDADGTPEIVTGGFTYDGQKTNAQLSVWSWNGERLELEKSQEWTTNDITEVKSVAIVDVDFDGRKEIITSGVSATYGGFRDQNSTQELAQLKVWGWDGKNLTLEQSQEWVVGEGVCAWNVVSDDFDNDGTVEIVTVGCMHIGNLCDPDMRIWSIAAPLSIELILVPVVGAAVIVATGTYFLVKRFRK